MGLSCSEIRNVPYSYMAWLIHRYSAINKVSDKDVEERPRKATDADIMALTLM